MKRYYLLLLCLCLLVASPLLAQKKKRKDKKLKKFTYEIKTLTNGKYDEIFHDDTLMQVGLGIINTVTGELVETLEEDTTYGGHTYYYEVPIRWLSIDPHAEKYPSYSGYNFVYNNPLLYIDPDGRDGIIYLLNPHHKGGKKISASEMQATADFANKVFGNLGISVQAKVWNGSATDFDFANIDPTDGVVALGSVTDIVDFMHRKSRQDGSIHGTYVDQLSWTGDGGYNISTGKFVEPDFSSDSKNADGFVEVSTIPQIKKIRELSVNRGVISYERVSKNLGTKGLFKGASQTQAMGYLVLHVAGHNAGIGKEHRPFGIMVEGGVKKGYTVESSTASELNQDYIKLIKQRFTPTEPLYPLSSFEPTDNYQRNAERNKIFLPNKR